MFFKDFKVCKVLKVLKKQIVVLYLKKLNWYG